MKKLIFTAVLILLGYGITVSAQDVKKTETQFTPGWYIGANGGVSWYFAEGSNFFSTSPDVNFSIIDNAGFMGRLVAGYNFTPVLGLRGMLGYTQNRWPDNRNNNIVQSFGAEYLTADFMVNVSNWVKGYNPNRLLDFSIFAGLGADVRNSLTDYANTNHAAYFNMPVRLGGQFDIRLNPKLDLNLIADASVVGDNYNGLDRGFGIDILPALALGVTYQLEKKEQTTTPIDDKLPIKDIEPVVTPVVKDSTPVVVPDVKPDKTIVPVIVQPEVTKTEVETAVDYLNEHIYFAINNRTPDTNEYDDEMKVIAKYVQQHPDVQIIVRGYADRGTGNIEVNNLISKQRAVNVANTLIRKYGVPYKNIWVRWYGGAIQPYNKNAKNNRLVIVHTPEVKQLVPARGADQKKNK